MNKTTDVETTTTVIYTDVTFNIDSVDLMKNCTDNKWYDITASYPSGELTIKYVGFWRDLKYRIQDRFEKLKYKIKRTYGK